MNCDYIVTNIPQVSCDNNVTALPSDAPLWKRLAGEPLFRAEAELLLDDADAFDPMATTRTSKQRRADALVEITTAAAKALDAA